MSTAFNLSVTIGFRDIYEGFEEFDINAEINKLPSVSAIKIIAHYGAYIHTRERNNDLQLGFFREWTSRLLPSTSERVEIWIRNIFSKGNRNVNLFNNRTSLEFLEFLYTNYNGQKQAYDFSTDQDELFFKCYTYISQMWVDKTQKAIPSKMDSVIDYLRVVFPLQFHMIEIIEFKDFRIQSLKAIYFFKFCEIDKEYNQALSIFLANKKAQTWQQYLLNVVGPYVSILAPGPEHQGHTVQLNMKDNSLKEFLDSLCADPTKYRKLSDYMFLRKFPLFKDGDDYLFVFMNFFIDKLYQSIKFDFGETIVKANTSFKGKHLRSLLDFLPYYGTDFAEKSLFYLVLEQCFKSKKGYILKRGEDLKIILGHGEPDYYIRDKNKIYLFEFKDTVISQTVKNSHNYEEIVEELEKKLYKNAQGNSKGITQLANTIEAIYNDTYLNNNMDKIDKTKIIIYPIIIFTDYCLNTRGVNYFLNKKFGQLLIDRKITEIDIRPLTLIDIDNLIKFQDLFIEKKIAINQCLNYFHGVFLGTEISYKTFTFNMAIHEITSKMKSDTPKMFFDELRPLIQEQGYTST
jgi:hypothetical protein